MSEQIVKALRELDKYIKKHGRGPTLMEHARSVGLTFGSRYESLLKELGRGEYISREMANVNYQARSMRLTVKGRKAIKEQP